MSNMTNNNSSEMHTYQGIPGTVRQTCDERIKAWQRLKYGMFIHWGPYSVLGGEYNGEPVTEGYSEQIQMWADIPDDDYLQSARQLSTRTFDPDAICKLAKEAGMRYIVMTSKHHDGFCMYDTDTTDYNIVKQTPGGNDPLKRLAAACKRHGLQFGIYFSLVDWHQGHDFDKNNNNLISKEIEHVLKRQLRELMTHYGPVAEVWFDMSNPNTEQSAAFRDIVRELQPEAVINSRVWNNAGDFRTLADNQIPSHALDCAWQTPASIYHKTWGFRRWQVREDTSGKARHLIESLVRVLARGGNYLLNIGPDGDGCVVPFETDVLNKIGTWVQEHHDAILYAEPTRFDPHVWGEITAHHRDLFLHVIEVPADRKLVLNGLASNILTVTEDGIQTELDWHVEENQLIITLPEQWNDDILPVIRVVLDGELRVIPSQTIQSGDDGHMVIQNNAIYEGYGFADKGDYNTLVETTVRKTAYFANRSAGNVNLTVQGKVDDHEQLYRVDVGEESMILSGEQLVATQVGPFKVEVNDIVSVDITLSEPEYPEEELGLKVDTIQVEKDI